MYLGEAGIWLSSPDLAEMDCITLSPDGREATEVKCRLGAGAVINSRVQDQLDDYTEQMEKVTLRGYPMPTVTVDVIIFTSGLGPKRKWRRSWKVRASDQ